MNYVEIVKIFIGICCIAIALFYGYRCLFKNKQVVSNKINKLKNRNKKYVPERIRDTIYALGIIYLLVGIFGIVLLIRYFM
jgi:di/tricarboxylate transporter